MAKSTGKNFLTYFALGIVAFILYQVYRPERSTEPTDQPAVSPLPQNLYALHPADNSWPPDLKTDQLAPNLLADNYYLVLDGSGSMDGSECVDTSTKMQAAIHALQQFVEQIPTSANIGLYVFDNTGSHERLALGNHAHNSVTRLIGTARAGGGTPLSAAITQGYNALTRQAAAQLGYGNYHLVIVTDGQASPGYEPTNTVSQILSISPVVMHTIGFCIGEDHSLNQHGLTFYKAADDPASLAQGLTEVLAEMPDFSVTAFGEN